MNKIRVEIDRNTEWNTVLPYLIPYHNLTPNVSYELILVFNSTQYVPGSVAALIVAYYLGLIERNFGVTTIYENEGNCAGLSYLSRMDFFNLLNCPFQYPYTPQDSGGRFIPFTVLSGTGYYPDPSFFQKVSTYLGLDQDQTNAINFAIGELYANIGQHSQSKNGILFGQIYPNKKRAELIITDPGRGIHNAFLDGNENFRTIDEKEALLICTNDSVTCGNGRGHGLYLIKELIKSNRGELRIISGGHSFNVVNTQESVINCNYWQGTTILIELDLSNNFNMDYVLGDQQLNGSSLW